MRFLVMSKNKHMPPMEMMPGLIDAMIAWSNGLTASGKAEAVWGTAGVPGGGGILNVDSVEELDALLTQNPFGPFSETTVVPIVELSTSLQNMKQVIQAMMPGGGS